MKASLYDYRALVGGRPSHITYEVPPDLEARFAIFQRNDWVIGYYQKPEQKAGEWFQVAIFDQMTDIVLAEETAAAEDEVARLIRRLCEVDPPLLDAALRAGLQRAPAPDADQETTEGEA